MLRKEELRVGNRVLRTWKSGIILPNDGEVRIHELREHQVMLIDEEGIKTIRPYTGLGAIEITQDLLIELGAIQRETDFLSFYLKGLQINYIEDRWIEYVHRIPLRGLHHLQNIFYFTRNEELITK